MPVVALVASVLPVASQERLSFVGVALDLETRQADRILQDYLYRTAGVSFAPEELEYARVIERLSGWSPEEGHYLARTTPYVYVAAEMLGADLEIIATYTSAATGRTTYNAYFVVSHRDFPTEPDLQDVTRFLKERQEPATFVYHSKFSTSSFYVPTLFFRGHNIFNMESATESLTAIHARPVAGSSTDLVRLVASGEAELAAVWDGTKAKFEPGHTAGLYESYGSKVHFVRLPASLPNDLLVCSRSLPAAVKERIRTAVSNMGPEEIGTGDFETWQDIRQATEARLALAELRWLAREATTPVTVEARLHDGARPGPGTHELLEATRQAIRLSGSEFVLFDEDFHEHIDFQWTLEPIHDGAVMLRSTIPGTGIEEQEFQISFRDAEGLTKRISSLVHDRLHRVRYLWPFSEDPPIVIRDTATSIPVGETVRVQRIHWLDPPRNSFRAGPVFDATIQETGFYRYQLEVGDLAEKEGQLDLDAMSNTAYRVVLVRPESESPLFRALTIAFIVLLALAAGGALIDLRRKPAVPVVSVRTAPVGPYRALNVDSGGRRSPHAGDADRVPRAGPRPERWH
jgi:ABC-type phosphate/phosphonate transport system substrate-binding protein